MKRISLILLSAAAFLTGCEKSFESFTPNQNVPTDTVWALSSAGNFSEVNTMHQNLVRPPLNDSFNLSVNSVIEFPDNIRIEIPANSLLQNGNAGTGKAAIEFFLLKSKGDFIRFRKPTTSNGYLLESGGAFNLIATKNGQPLALSPFKMIKVTYRDANPNPAMMGFTGSAPLTGSGATNFNWVQDDSAVSVRAIQTGYEVYTNKLNWINCDYFRDTAELKTRIALIMPVEFTNTNTSTFIVYRNIKAVMQMDADAVNRIWRKDRVPVNRQVIYVTISKRGTDYFLGTKELSTGINQNVEIRPEKRALQEIKNFLDGL
ncbi:MAG: hypothetical protein V4722_21055 [Bacteroidota bacterium]